ncbi:MAG: Mitomycin resistance protein McrB [Candidatus Parcubacteria bacterium]
MVRDFTLLGLKSPSELKKQDPYKLYQKICKVSGVRQDPCVLDTYMAALDFMNGAPARPWFYYTKERKKRYSDI